MGADRNKDNFENLVKDQITPLDKLNELPPDKKDEKVKGLDPAKHPHVPREMLIQKGMIIHFGGYRYKCTAKRPNHKVTMKFMGKIK